MKLARAALFLAARASLEGHTSVGAVSTPSYRDAGKGFCYLAVDGDQTAHAYTLYAEGSPGSVCKDLCNNLPTCIAYDYDGNNSCQMLFASMADRDAALPIDGFQAIYVSTDDVISSGVFGDGYINAQCFAKIPTVAGPWNIDQDAVRANFTNASTLELDYITGVGREYQEQLLQKGCKNLVDTTLYSTTNFTTPINQTYHKLTLIHEFNTSELAQSIIWNSTSSKLEVCQKLNLVIDDMVIVQNLMDVDVIFDLEANFDTDVNLEKGVIYNETEQVDFEKDINAFKCNGGSTQPFKENFENLAPNQELAVCITSQDANVNVAELTDMTIKQDDPQGVKVVFDGVTQVEAITSVSPPTSDGILVTTRVPLDRFSFETGKNITISGSVKLELVGTDEGRKLRALVEEEGVGAAGPEEVGYAVTVSLQSEVDGVGEGQVLKTGSSDGYAIVGKGSVVIGLAVVALVM